MARRIKERKLRNPAITIIGDGATERYYFTHPKLLNGYNYVCKPRNFAEQNIDDIQRQVERVLADDGIAVCVFDVDVTRIHPADKVKFDAMRRRYAGNPSVIICESMPSIEFWFLLHYPNTNRYFASSDDVIALLHRFLPNFSKQQSFLSRDNWVAALWPTTNFQQPSPMPLRLETKENHIPTFISYSRFLIHKATYIIP